MRKEQKEELKRLLTGLNEFIKSKKDDCIKKIDFLEDEEQKQELKNILESLNNGLIKTQETSKKILLLNDEEQEHKKQDEKDTKTITFYYDLIKAILKINKRIV